MKRLFIFITVVCALFVTSCYEDSTTNDRISNLENDKIASIEEQINAILSTLSVLKEETHPLILSKIGVLESNAESNAELIATLKAQAESVANQISELTNHCKQLEDSIGLYGEKEWIESTFATLEQYANMQSVVASLQANIAGLSEEVKNSIAEVENSMKSWISVQLSSYCTIAEMESKLAELRAENKDNDAAVANKIAELEKMFEAVYHEITEAYKQSIADAISNNNGEINKKIAKDIATAEARIDSKLETINAEINDIKERLHIVEVKVGDIESQITEINTTLDLLQKVDEILSNELTALEAESYELCQQYAAEIEALRVQIANLEAEKAQIQADMATNTANIEVLKDAHNACIELIQSLDSEISNITMVMHAYMDEVSMRIENIRAEQEMLKAQIATLQEYVEYELSQKADKDWAEATFATLEQYAQMQNLLDALQKQISSLDKNDDEEGGVDCSAIQEAINAAEESMKGWVSEQLAGYCTISQLEAELATLRQELANNEAISQAQILELQAQIDSLHKLLYDMKAEYLQTLNMIEAAMKRQDDSICAILEEINAKICPSINEIKNQIDDLWEFISKRIQSITYIPKYTDEKATIIKTLNVDEGVGELDFLVLPKQAVETIQVSDVSMKAVETISRAVNFIDMPIISVKTTDLANGVLTVRVSGKNLGDDFYEGKKEFKATLIISNGENEISSEFITLTPQVEEGSTSTNNKIFYTSSDGNIIKPYSGNYNSNATAMQLFGANIVSNTYENGVGVITFDGDVTTIGELAFYDCSALTSVTIPDNVTSIGSYAFHGCVALTSVTIGNSVTTIGSCAFSNCDALTSITIPDSVTTIGDYAFESCDALTSITIPDSVTTIGYGTFAGCEALKAFYGKFASKDNRCLIVNGVLNSFAPAGLTTYSITNSVTKIGIAAFQGCSALKSVTIPDSVTTIGYDAFRNCSALTSITIPDSVTTIGYSAFYDCSALTSVTIPDSVTAIGNEAFYDCRALKEVYCKPTTPPIADKGSSSYWIAFKDNASGRKIYVPTASVDAYKAADGWKEYADAIVAMPIPSNEIWYTSSDGNIVTPNATDVFGANIVSNTYENGQGIITFDGEVTIIGENAFYQRIKLTSIIIPDSVTKIGNSAFYNCPKLTSVTIPDSVTTIGEEAFRICLSLTNVTIPNSVTTIGGSAFGGCKCLTSVTIPDSVTKIGEGAFTSCNKLKAFYGKFASADNRCLIVDGVLEAFAPAGLTEYTIPDSVTTIGHGAFSNSNLTSVTIPNNITKIEDSGFWNCVSLTSVTIPDSVTTIGDWAFYKCSSLTSVTIGNGVSSIGHYAFYDCESLKEVYCMPTTPPSLEGSYVFDNNASDRKIYVPAASLETYKAAEGWKEYADYIFPMPEESQNNKIFYTSSDGNIIKPYSGNYNSNATAMQTFGANITSNTYENGVGVITFDGDVTTIGELAFYNCSALTSVTIPDSVTTIGYEAFYSCTKLASVTIPDSVTTIGDRAFDSCRALTSVTIPDSVTTIGVRAFDSCEALTSVTIPDSVTTIGHSAFSGCNALTSVTIPDSVTTIGFRAFYNCSALTSVTIPDSVTTIGDSAFDSCEALTSVTIPDSVTTIGDRAFYSCSALTSITIPDSVTTIGREAFYSCDALTSVTIPDSVTTIGDSAFDSCEALTSVTIPDSVTTIGDYAFYNCDALTSVTIPDSVTTIGSYAFCDCYALKAFYGKYASKDNRCLIVDGVLNSFAPAGLTTYSIPDSVTTIGYRAFEDCSALTSVTIPDSVTTIRNSAFRDCSALKSITIPDSVTTIGNDAFRDCDALTSVTIGNGVTTIGYDAFYKCSSLKKVYCKPTTPPSLGGSSVFDSNASGRKIYVPTASVDAYKAKQNWSEYADAIEPYNFAE